MKGNTTNRTRTFAAAALALLAATLLAACGSSSNGSSTSSGSAAASTTATGGSSQGSSGKTGSIGSRFDAFRECLKRQGITLPQRVPRKPGQSRPPAGGAVPFGLSGPKLPKGVSRSRYEAALKKCGGGGGGRFARRPGAVGGLRNPAFAKQLAKFAECMRKAGVNVPSPNTSGSGPVFNTKGIDTSSASFRAAEQKCRSLLRFGRPGGAGAPPGAAAGQPGAPPAEPGK